MARAGQTPASRSHRAEPPTTRHIVDRRRFFKQFIGETVALIDEMQGRPQCKLTDLWELSNQELAVMIPQVCSGVEIVPADGVICARLPENEGLLTLFASSKENLSIFNGFNGVNSIGRIAGELSVRTGFDMEESYERVRSLFLQTVRLRVCIPGNEGSPQTGPLPEGDINHDVPARGMHEAEKA
jgi:hypothetical protein